MALYNNSGINKIRKLQGSLPRSKNILLFTYQRSGANLLSDLLTLGPNTALFSEPFTYRRVNLSSNVEDIAEGLLSCQQETLAKFLDNKSSRVIRKLGRWKNNNSSIKLGRDNAVASKCSRMTVKVLETTRVHLNALTPLIERKMKKDIDKWMVVHLVRDPRYVLDGRGRGLSINVRTFCTDLLDDVELGMNLDSRNYFMIRYEELVNNPMATLRHLYAFLGLSSWILHAKDYLQKHQYIKKSKMVENEKKGLNPAIQKKIEKECKRVIRVLGYNSYFF